MNENSSKLARINNVLFFLVAVFFIVIVAREFLYPIALAMLLSYLLYPIARFMENKARFPRILAVLITIISAIVIISLVVDILYQQFRNITSDFPLIKAHTLHKMDLIQNFIETNFGIAPSSQNIYLKNAISKFFDQGADNVTKLFATTTGTILRVVLLPVFSFFMLYYRNKAEEFVKRVTPAKNREKVASLTKDVSQITTKYMGGVVIVVAILSIINSLGLFIIGMDYAIFLGIVAALCNIIPYFGTIIGFSIPFVFALLLESSPQTALLVIVLFFIVQFIENNILTPNIVGHNVRLNPFVIILSLIVGAMVWGIPGMIVVIPIIAVLRLLFDNIHSLKPYAFILGTGGTEKHALTISTFKKTIKNLTGIFRRRP